MSNPNGARFDASIVVPFAIFTLVWSSTWIVIRDQLGTPGSPAVPPQWSVAYRFLIAAPAMALVARWNGDSLRLGAGGLAAAALLGFSQFFVNFNSVYLAERYITSGIVATFFALLLIPTSLLAWALLGHRPDRRFVAGGAVAVAGVALMFVSEARNSPIEPEGAMVGLGFTLLGLLGAAVGSVYQAGTAARRHPLFTLLAWAMAFGALFDVALALAIAGPPTFDPRPGYFVGLLYLALAASVLCFSLYYPVARRIGPGRAAYSSVLVPIVAMALSTLFEGYRWTAIAAAGAALALGGMVIALGGPRRRGEAELVAAPDAA